MQKPEQDEAGATELAIPAPARPARAEPSREDPLIGREIDHYRILGHVGVGGMGVVYKAKDVRLQRTVALKLLPPSLTRDPVAKARFLQEARAASALDHPNVCTVYDVGEIEEEQLYLAMPAYDGETVKRKIERGGPLPIEEAVDIAKQVAQGLAKAHRQGIVHRDVKPANLMVTRDGIVKILDFGLAKLAGSAGLTRTGFCVGTPTYMSPEQARGEVDHRTDLWSLGVVLYEMLTGRVPFQGDSDPAIVHSVLHDEPPPLRRLRPDTPPGLERIVSGLLTKNLAERYPSAEQVLDDLRALGGPPTTTGRPPAALPRRLLPVLGVLAVLAVLSVGWWLRARADRPPVPGPVTQLTWQEGSELQPALAPDGSFLVYVRQDGGDTDLFWELLQGDNPRNLTEDSPADETDPAISPDGRQIAFRSERDGGGIFLMGATGESVRRLTNYGFDPAWSPDGKEIVVAMTGFSDPNLRLDSSELWRVPLDGSEPRLLVKDDGAQPSWSPHGERIAFWSLSSATGQRALRTIRPDGSDPVQILSDTHLNWNPVWSADGRNLFFLSDRGGSRNLWRVRIDEASGRALDEPEPVRAPSESLASLTLGGQRIVYATYESRANVERVAFDPEAGEVVGTPSPVTRSSWAVRTAMVSPDGQWIALDTSAPREDLFLIRSDGSGTRQLTDDVHKDRGPRWAPDGSSILFYSNRSGKYEAWRIRPDGGGLEALTRLPEPVYSPLWSPDGRRLIFSRSFEGTSTVDLGTPIERRLPQPLGGRGLDRNFAADTWSPDGQWLAGFAGEPGIFVYSPGSRRLVKLTGRGRNPTWLHDSRRLLYLDQGRLFAVDVSSRKTRELLVPLPGSQLRWVSVGADGRSLFLVRQQDEGDVWLLPLK